MKYKTLPQLESLTLQQYSLFKNVMVYNPISTITFFFLDLKRSDIVNQAAAKFSLQMSMSSPIVELHLC